MRWGSPSLPSDTAHKGPERGGVAGSRGACRSRPIAGQRAQVRHAHARMLVRSGVWCSLLPRCRARHRLWAMQHISEYMYEFQSWSRFEYGRFSIIVSERLRHHSQHRGDRGFDSHGGRGGEAMRAMQQTNERTDGRTDGRTDDARTHSRVSWRGFESAAWRRNRARSRRSCRSRPRAIVAQFSRVDMTLTWM